MLSGGSDIQGRQRYRVRKVQNPWLPGALPEDPGTPIFDQLVAESGLEYLRAACLGNHVGCPSWEIDLRDWRDADS